MTQQQEMTTFQLTPGLRVECRDGTHDLLVFNESWREDQYRMTTLPRPYDGAWALDLGANVGAWSILAAKAGARVVAVECWEPNVDRLKVNLLETNTHAVWPIVGAVVGHPAEFVYLDNIGDMSQVGVQTHDFNGDEADSRPFVQAIHINALLAQQEHWWCLKSDIEGGEFDVFAGVDPGLLNRVDYIVMEFHGGGMGEHVNWIGDKQFGDLVTKLCDWGNITTLGRASMGGNIYGHRNGVQAPILGAERQLVRHWLR